MTGMDTRNGEHLPGVILCPGWVYFIQAGHDGPVKIGWTLDRQSRLELLQSAHYERLFMIHSEPGSLEHERELHQRYGELRIRGEWFEAAVLEVHLGEDGAFEKWLDATAEPCPPAARSAA